MMQNEQVEILLADDSRYDAEMTMRSLKKHLPLCKVHWVKDGAEALDFLFCEGAHKERKGIPAPKLVLLDVNMPKVNGIEVLEKIKADETLKNVRAVIMTSSEEQRDIKSAYDLGVNSFVVKPLEFDAFSKVVAEIGLYWMVANKADHRL